MYRSQYGPGELTKSILGGHDFDRRAKEVARTALPDNESVLMAFIIGKPSAWSGATAPTGVCQRVLLLHRVFAKTCTVASFARPRLS
jgi:hypothetical protein